MRGRDIKQGRYEWAGLYIINTHNGYKQDDGTLIPRIVIQRFPSLKKHLDKYFETLKKRDDQGDTPYNLRSCGYMDDLNKQKIIYSEIVQKPQFYFDEKGEFIPEASAFYLACEKMEHLVDYLNNPLAGWIFKKYYAGGGLGDNGYRYKKAFFINLPIPKDVSKNPYISFNFTEDEIAYLNKIVAGLD